MSTADNAILLQDRIKAMTEFPDQNPNPVLQVDAQATLLYSNPASQPLLDEWGIRVGDVLPHPLDQTVPESTPTEPSIIELEVANKTFIFNVVSLPSCDVINIYATDITATKVIAKFPLQNPNPVIKVSPEGHLIFANDAGTPIIKACQMSAGDLCHEKLLSHIKIANHSQSTQTIELGIAEKTFIFRIVPVPEFDFINIYGTDITDTKALEVAHRENERLLLNILPAAIADRLKSGEDLIADKLEGITILFADLVGFTQLSAGLPARETVDFLNDIFSAFDGLSERYGLEKIKTIGDAYMVAGGLNNDPSSASRVADMALGMLTEIDRFNAQSNHTLNIRIGMHTGTVVAGVIGLKKFIYDIWGDAVNTASRMESHGIAGKIQVSADTYQHLKGEYVLEDRGMIEVKGKGDMHTYFLLNSA
jgi:class 3 adenylate cyclase